MWPFKKKYIPEPAPEPLSFDFEQRLTVDGKDAYIIPTGYRKAMPDEYTLPDFKHYAMIVSFSKRKWLSVIGADGQLCAEAFAAIGHPIPYIVPIWWNCEAMKNNKAYMAMLTEWNAGHKTPAMDAWNEWGHNPYDERHEQQRRAREEGKMKLEPGRYYEVDGYGIHKLEQEHGELILSKYYVDADRAVLMTNYGDKRILREVLITEASAPLRLEVGKSYALNDGSVEWCEMAYPDNDLCFRLGTNHYWISGRPTDRNNQAPRPIYRLKVNEHMDSIKIDVKGSEGAGNLFQERVSEAKKNMEGLKPETMKAMRDCLDAMLMEREKKDPIPVTYRILHHEDKPCTREPIIPEGYEIVIYGGPGYDTRDINHTHWFKGKQSLYPYDDLLVHLPSRNAKPVFIRPIKPFRLSGPGWYKTRGGGWIKNPPMAPYWEPSGAWRSSSESHIDLIARATPSQAAILDAL